MALKGNLRDFSTTQLLNLVNLARKTGKLTVNDQDLNAVLVSLNGDFGDITTYPPSQYKGIIALQVRSRPEVIPSLMHRLMNYLSDHPEMRTYEGQLLLVEAHRIRIRK